MDRTVEFTDNTNPIVFFISGDSLLRAATPCTRAALCASTLKTASAPTDVLPKFPHSNCCKRVPNRPLRGRTVATEFQIGLCGVVEADLELFCNCWSAGFPWPLGQGALKVGLHTTPLFRGRQLTPNPDQGRAMDKTPY